MLIKNIIFKFYFRHLLLKDIEKTGLHKLYMLMFEKKVHFLHLCAEKQTLTQEKRV